MPVAEHTSRRVIGEAAPADEYLSEQQVRSVAARGLAQLEIDGKRVLLLIPDGTRTMPMPLMFDILTKELGPRAAAVDFLIALGTHPPMSDRQLAVHLGVTVIDGVAGENRIFNHQWDDPGAFATLGTIPAWEIEQLTNGRMREAVPVRLNKRMLEYDHVLICGPVFPHEVAGFSGGEKYFFPGIGGPELINLTHWLGALITNYELIGTVDTAVRRVIHRAVEMIEKPHSLLALVVNPQGVAGVYCGPTERAWRAAAGQSSERHIVWLDKPVERILAILPEMYTDLWTGGKGMYKLEPAVADGGEVVIYAPHIHEVSRVHGRLIEEIGYHCRDYFLAQWDRFRDGPGGILAHSTHVKGKGTYDTATGVEKPRIQVTLATGIPHETCRKINLGYLDPASVDVRGWQGRTDWLVVPRAGEMLYRFKSF